MIAVVLAQLATALSPEVLAAAESDGGPVWLLALGPAGAAGMYFLFWRYYRNTHTSHSFERETRIEAQPISGNDSKVNEIKGTRKSSIDGDNRSDHRRRIQRAD